ncbi:major facilitator superfamily protein (plasmid) [Rhizobium etli bv. mimosae str. IE4771]|uniref:Major facilitator superfamily protein n=1 Tax=Rhizobium etli bv. mimosae str. IE4771 TaxID=1432050 RepID=A0A060I9X6_RHIET|nr:MFS transporter [Rhizobium sp. IE4771]AIC30489.1 major facilitator superfamily protein [Rhizobium sp. IE4771]
MNRLFPDVFRNPAIRASMIAIFTFGMAGAMTAPYRSVIGIRELGLSDGLYSALSFVSAAVNVVISVLLGNLADRLGEYRSTMIGACIFGIVGYGMVYAFPTAAIFIISGLLPLPIFGALNSLLFANARAAMQGMNRSDMVTANSGVRAMISLSWVLIPGITGLVLSGASSMLPAYLFAGLSCVLCLGIIIFALPKRAGAMMAELRRLTYIGALREVVSPRISAHIAGVALITSTLHLNDALLPLIATGAAHGRLSDVGILVGIVALLEVIFIIVWSRIARQAGQMTALAAGTIIYALFLGLLGFASQPWHLYALTLLAGIGAAAIISIPITYLQDLIADRPGLGSALISVNIFASAGIGALVFAAGTWATGYSGTAVLSAVTGLSGIALLGLLQRRPAVAPVDAEVQ